ncbi:YtxH domain-containing protein [Candidatus Roizmanbacteria bacterium]|nr:MAG: YtxH domain-containing protein [Candidatus Roizmanbacteria bacterium]
MGKSKFGAGLLLGALLGGAAAFFLSPKTGKENREMAKKKLAEWKERYEGKSPEEIAKEIFGSASAEGKRLYMRAQDEMNKQLDKVKKSANEIDQEKYADVVRDVMDRLKEEKEATKERLVQLQEYLMDRWEYVSSESEKDAKKVAKDATKKTPKK